MFFHNHRFCCYIVLPILFSLLSHLPSYPPYGRVDIEVPKTSRAQVTNLYPVATQFYRTKVPHNSNTFKIPTDTQQAPDYIGPEPTIIPTETQLVPSYMGPEPYKIPTGIQRVPHYIGHEPTNPPPPSFHPHDYCILLSYHATLAEGRDVCSFRGTEMIKYEILITWLLYYSMVSTDLQQKQTIYIRCISRNSRCVNTGHWGPIGHEGGWGRWTRSQSKMSWPSRERRFVRDLLREERNKFQLRASRWQHYLKCEVESCGNTFGFEVVARH